MTTGNQLNIFGAEVSPDFLSLGGITRVQYALPAGTDSFEWVKGDCFEAPIRFKFAGTNLDLKLAKDGAYTGDQFSWKFSPLVPVDAILRIEKVVRASDAEATWAAA